MHSVSFRSLLSAGLLAAVLSACSGDSSSEQNHRNADTAPEFSQEDKIAARSLSLSNTGDVERADSPQAQAQMCSAAIEVLRVRLRDSGTLTEEQLLALGEAKAIYDRRVRGIVAGEADDAPAGEADAGETSVAQQARIAIGCLQYLQIVG